MPISHHSVTPSMQARACRLWQAVRTLDFSHHQYALWKRYRGLDLTGESCESIGIDARRGHYHAESGGPELETVLKALNLPRSYGAVDIGSGKGGAAFTMAKYFRHVTGIELSERLVRIADANQKKLDVDNVLFLREDATTFEPKPDERVFYLFNPFPAHVVAQVAASLMASTLMQSGDNWVIYKNPVVDEKTGNLAGHEAMLAAGWKLQRKFEFTNGWPCYVYYN